MSIKFAGYNMIKKNESVEIDKFQSAPPPPEIKSDLSLADLDLHLILRTHNTSNVHSDSDSARYCGETKTELMRKCVTSLIYSMNQSQKKLKLTILDDNSNKLWLDILNEKLLPHSKHPVTLINLKTKGFNASALAQFEIMAESTGLVYSIEDDYLHETHAIDEMLETRVLFENKYSNNNIRKIALYPFDMPDNYIPPWLGPCTVVLGTNRHWKSGVWTTNTMLIPAEKVREHWKLFYVLATEYRTDWGIKNNIHEGSTIANIFKEDMLLFSPIPSIALHMQFEAQKDPYIDWKKRWNEVPNW